MRNKEKHNEYMRKWRKNHPGYYRAYQREWMQKYREENREKVRAYGRSREHIRRVRRKFSFADRLRHRIYLALKGNVKAGKTLELLGIPLWMFRWYLETKFQPGMTWENYGPVWHIDHIRPCVNFDFSNLEQQKICFRWDNMQPLFAGENLRKGGKYVHA